MPWPVYSERFIVATPASGTTVMYTVPMGKRAVFRTLTATNYAGATGTAYSTLNNQALIYADFQATIQSKVYDLYTVAYGGDFIKLGSSAGGIAFSLSGHLFDDPARGVAPPYDIVQEDQPQPLPSLA